jgi:ubiquinone/menaquinone biosynthesis C-methylase UbiE
MPYRQTIAAAYDCGAEEEYRRLTETALREAEYSLIIELLDEYIPVDSVVIDIGSGPGRYAEYLMMRECKVGVVDLSAKSLKAFSDRMENVCCKGNTLFNQVSCATQLNWIADNSADAILIMGPLYHLITEEHRNIALSNCHRILKPGGFIFTVFLSPFPILNKLTDCKVIEKADKDKFIFSDECHITHTSFQGFNVPQFRCWPCDAREIMKSNDFEIIRTRNIEGVGSFFSDKKLKEFDTPDKKAELLSSLRMTSETATESGITHQYIIVGRKNS